MNIYQVLSNLGLQDKEPDIYLTLIKMKGAQPASLIATRANLNRSTVYKGLLKLTKKGLITKTQKHGVTYFFAEDPEGQLKSIVDEKQKQYDLMNQVILESIPLFISNDTQGNLPKIRYYEGIEGIKQIYEIVLKTGADVYRYGDITKIYNTLGVYTDEFIKKRGSAKITTHAIMPLKDEEEKNLEKHTRENRKTLFIKHEYFPIDGEIRIFGNKVAIMSLKEESLIGVVIESETIAKMFLSVFMLTWKNYSNQKI